MGDFWGVGLVWGEKEGMKWDMDGGECVLVKGGDVRLKGWSRGGLKDWGD